MHWHHALFIDEMCEEHAETNVYEVRISAVLWKCLRWVILLLGTISLLGYIDSNRPPRER